MQPHSNRLLIAVGATLITWILRVSLAGLACLSNPCLNGICIDDINSSFICFCEDGFTGELCGTNWDECWSSPCENGGSCTDSIAAFNCSCPPGFSGEKCEWNVDECASSPCLNGGSCIDQENGFVCSCPAGYAGHFCTIDVSVCNISYPMPHIPGPRCFNGGVCLDGPGPYFSCVCVDGWTGSRCEVQTDECTSAPCKNGGLCIDLVADYSCACPFGYTGKTCEMTLQMCRGINGSRINIFGGVTVESLTEEDEEDICENGALCLIESNSERVCYCVPDFHGDRCQFRYDECLLAESASWSGGNGSNAVAGGHCQNGGECIDGVDSFSCSCPAEYTGRFCECPLFILPGTDIDPYCLSTSTEFTPSMTSLSTSISTSFFTAGTQPTATDFVETTTQDMVSPEFKTTQEVTSKVFVDSVQTTQASTSISEETLSTAIDTESHMTGSTSPILPTVETGDFTTLTPTSPSFSTFPHTLYTEISTKETTAVSTDSAISSTKLSPELPESSTISISTIRGVIGEDKIWHTEEMTSSTAENTSTTLTYTITEPAHHETSIQGEVATKIILVESKPESTTALTTETAKVTDDLPGGLFTTSLQTESTKTEHTQFVSTGPSTLSSDSEVTHGTTYTKTDLSTKWIDFTTYTELLSTTESRAKAGDDVTIPSADTETTYTSETTDLLVTYLYTSEKTTVMLPELSTEEITVTDSVTTEQPYEPRHSTFDYSQTTQDGALSEEITSTPYGPIDGKDEITTGLFIHPGHSSEATFIPEEVSTSTISEFHSPSIFDTYSIPEESTEMSQPSYTSQTTSKIESITTLESTSFSPPVSGIFTEVTEPTVTEKQYASSTHSHTTETSKGTIGTMTETSTKSSTDTSTYTSIDTSITTPSVITTTFKTFTEVTSFDVSEVDDHTEIASSTGIMDESEPPTESGCNVIPCFNGGTCYYNECECTFRFTGTLCEKKKHIEVASFNGHSYLLHSLNISEFSNQGDQSNNMELEDAKVNFKRHSDESSVQLNSTSSNDSDTTYLKEESLDVFEEAYDYYEEHTDTYNFSTYNDYELEEPFDSMEEKDFPFTTLPETTTEPTHNSNQNLTSNNNTILDKGHISSTTENPSVSSALASSSLPTASYSDDKTKISDGFTSESIRTSNSLEITMENSATKPSNAFKSFTQTMGGSQRQRGGRSLKSLPPISTSISVKINLQERSLKVGGWGLVMKVTLGNMAKASLTINHITGLLRFHFTCGLGRSLLFGEEDGQRWADLGPQQPFRSVIIPVLVVLEVFPYEAVHKNNPSSGRSYLQCAASLKINGQVAVKGQQRAPMPKKSSSGRDASQHHLHLGGVPEMLLPCNHAMEDPISSGREQLNNYEQKHHEEEEEGFVGCMQDLKINGVVKQIFEDALDGNGIIECGEKILIGKELESDDNPCFSLPCYGSSTCEPTGNGSWKCRCPTGWLGINCDQSVCDNNPCLYGATCLQDDAGGFVCLCPLGKGGRLCENDLEITKPCFDSGNGWDVEEYQPYIAYPLDHNHLSSPQLVFRFKFSPSSINQIGLLAYIGDLKLPKSLHSLHPSILSELKDLYFETTTLPTTLESSHLTEYPISSSKDAATPSPPSLSTQTSLQEDVASSTPSNLEQSAVSPLEDSLSKQDFLPPLDIPLFQDDAPPYLQNFTSVESFNSYSNYVFSPFAPYPYYVRQNGRDHMAVSYIRGHLVLTWDLGSGPRRIFTNKPIPILHEEDMDKDFVENLPIHSISSGNYTPFSENSAKYPSSSNSTKETVFQSSLNLNSSHSESNSKIASSSPYILQSNQMFPSYRDSKRIQSTLEVNSSKEKPISKVLEQPRAHDSNSSEKNESGHNVSTQTKDYSFKETRKTKLSTTTPDASSLPEMKEEKQNRASDLDREGMLPSATESNNNEGEETNSFPYEESIPPPPFMSAKILPSPTPDHYHEVTVWREGQQAWLKVGDQVVRGQSPGRHYQLNAHRPFLYLGGHDASNISSLPHDIPLHSSFSGCVFDADLRFGGGHSVPNRRVSMFTKGRGVGECGQDPCKGSLKSKDDESPCLNGGRCIPHGPTFICVCQKSWFGPLCADSGHNPCDEGVHSCKSGSTCVTMLFGGYKCDCLPGTHGLTCEKDSPIGWAVKLTGNRSFLGVRVPFQGRRKRPQSSSLSDKSKREAFCIDLEIKPSRPSNGGIVLFVMGSHQDEFLSLNINNKGEPELRIGPGSSRMVGPLVIGFNGKFQRENINEENEKSKLKGEKGEGQIHLPGWRKIRIFRRGQRVFLAMDGLLHGAGTLNSPFQNLPSIRPYNNSAGSSLPLLYLGGLPDLAMLPQNAVGDVKMARPFAGCIRSLAVDWQRVPLGEGSGSYGRNAFSC